MMNPKNTAFELREIQEETFAEYDREVLGRAAHYLEKLSDEVDTVVREREEYNGKHQAACLEIGRLREAFRVNALRWGYTDAEIDAVLNQQLGPLDT